MCLRAFALGGLLLLAPPTPRPSPSPSPAPSPSASPGAPVILFLIDNSASLPPLDPDEKRVAALEKMFTFLKGAPYRLVLFAGRREIAVDDVTKYNNRGQWTDFYYAFDKAREIVQTYPPKTQFRIILLTDGLLDPLASDWADVPIPAGQSLKDYVAGRTIELVRNMKIPLYVILVGEIPPKAELAPNDAEKAPQIVVDLIRAANGYEASTAAQSLASFFKDDGLLLKKFVFRVPPEAGLKSVEPVIKRITAPAKPAVEFQFFTFLVLPLLIFLFVLLGLLVRSFPGPGDTEIIELEKGVSVHLGADRRQKGSGFTTMGLSLVGDAKDAVATVTYQPPPVDLSGIGFETSGLDAPTQKLLPLGLDDLRRAVEQFGESGTKEEKIYCLNLDYMAKNFEPAEAEKILTGPMADRRRIGALDFLRAKVHLLSNEELRKKLTEARATIVTYGKGAVRKDLVPGGFVKIGRYGFLVKDVGRGGRKDVRLVLYYDRVPSLFALKTILPDFFQQLFRFRRSSQRIVSGA
jgi:hypothetical protein